MRRTFLFILLSCLYIHAEAQQKMSYEQVFRNQQPAKMSKALPSISGWADADHYILSQRSEDGSKNELVKVNAKTGKTSAYTAPASPVAPKIPTAKELGIENAMNLTPSPDGKWAAYTLDNNLYAIDLATKKTVQFTNDGSKFILNGYASWVYFEEILGRRSRYKAFWWADDSKHIAYMRFDDSEVPVFPIYVADGQHGFLENTPYPKPGDKNPEVKIGITSVDNPKTVWADFNEKDDQYFGPPLWTTENSFWVQWMNRGQDSLQVYQINLNDGSKQLVYEEVQKTWIDLDETARFRFLANGNFIIKSDKDGWENLYLHNKEGKLLNQITTGPLWGTRILEIDEKKKEIYLSARREHSGRFDLYKVSFDGKNFNRLSFGDYSHDQINLAPGGKYFITTYSNVSTPPTMALVDAKGKILRELGSSKGEDFEKYAIPLTEYRTVKSSDGKFDLPLTITYPVDFDKNKRYPVLVSIYGGPNAGSVYDRWKPAGGATQWWAQEGIIQVALDNRSSGHFGKEGLNYIHRKLGIYEIEDYMDGGRWLRQQAWVDTSRIAITGGSFGGYLTCMALTYGADVFTHGIANASVTDWRLYDTHYTERFMDTPEENPTGYTNTSVMSHVDKYRGLLRIVHGTTDDNVHMQNSIQLIDKLQDLNKKFEFMLYPNERHGIGANKVSKAIHNRTEAYEFYYRNLLGKEMPEAFRSGTSPQRRSF